MVTLSDSVPGMRITVPWGGIAFIGGVIVLTMTDWPSIVGWAMVVWGIITLILQVIVVTIVAAGMRGVKSAIDNGTLNVEDFYKTSHGRSLRRPLVQRTNVRGVKSKGNVTIDSKQSTRGR